MSVDTLRLWVSWLILLDTPCTLGFLGKAGLVGSRDLVAMLLFVRAGPLERSGRMCNPGKMLSGKNLTVAATLSGVDRWCSDLCG